MPAGYFDLVLCTFVLEHVPQFWRALPSLSRLLKPGRGVLLFAIPFVMRYHPHPGDFWRMTAQGAAYALESSNFDTCLGVSDGERAAALHTLGMGAPSDVPPKYLQRRAADADAPYRGAAGGNHALGTSLIVAAQRLGRGGARLGRRCGHVPRINTSDLWEIDYAALSARVFWPSDVDAISALGRCFAGGAEDAGDAARLARSVRARQPALRDRMCDWMCSA